MRTEQDILKDFEKLGFKVERNSDALCLLSMNDFKIDIRKYGRKYSISEWDYLDIQEHKLLHELFKCWGWLDE